MLIGLTGGIASGKSTVSNMFIKLGLPVVDADIIAREVVRPNEEAWLKIVENFGQDVLQKDNTIDRKKLGEIIFNDIKKRELLNSITHPVIIARLMKKASELHKKHTHVVVDIPLLFESKREQLFDLIVVVYVDQHTQIQRLMVRDKIEREEALTKIKSQMSLELKKEKADYIINNSEGVEETENQIKHFIHNRLGKMD